MSTTDTEGNLPKLCVMFQVAEGFICVNVKLLSPTSSALTKFTIL